MDRKDYVAEREGGWAVMAWDGARGIYVEPMTLHRTRREAEVMLREDLERSRAAAVLGRKGGTAGRGAAKARPLSSERAREIRAMRKPS